MRKSDSFSRRAGDFLAGRGFYIVLILCVAVIAASAWAMLRNSSDDFGAQDLPVMAETPSMAQQPPALPTFGGDQNRPPAERPSPNVPEDNEETFFGNNREEEVEAPAEETPPAEAETPAPPPQAPVSLQFVWPVLGEVENYHVVDRLTFNRTMGDFRTHPGIDIRANLGETVLAMADGVVERVFMDDLLGKIVLISHANGMQSLYANLMDTPLVEEGQHVTMGMPIGAVGQTALIKSGIVHHLHFEILVDGVQQDPLEILPARP